KVVGARAGDGEPAGERPQPRRARRATGGRPRPAAHDRQRSRATPPSAPAPRGRANRPGTTDAGTARAGGPRPFRARGEDPRRGVGGAGAGRREGGRREMTDAAVEVRELVKRYPRSPVNAVDAISFQVERGEVFGLLGPNGAGKTTTVGVLTTRVRPTSGSAHVGGVDVVRDPVL